MLKGLDLHRALHVYLEIYYKIEHIGYLDVNVSVREHTKWY